MSVVNVRTRSHFPAFRIDHGRESCLLESVPTVMQEKARIIVGDVAFRARMGKRRDRLLVDNVEKSLSIRSFVFNSKSCGSVIG